MFDVNLGVSVVPQLEEWIWTQLTVTEEEELLAKVWLDGQDEPKKESGSAEEVGRPKGPVALIGKAMEAWGNGGAVPIYDEVEVWDKDGPSERIAVISAGRLAATWARIKAR